MFGNAWLDSKIVKESKRVISNKSQGGSSVREQGWCLAGEGIQRGLPGAGRVLPVSPDIGHTGVCLVRNHEVVRLCLCIVFTCVMFHSMQDDSYHVTGLYSKL